MYVTHCERVQMIEHIHYKIVEQTLSVETLRHRSKHVMIFHTFLYNLKIVTLSESPHQLHMQLAWSFSDIKNAFTKGHIAPTEALMKKKYNSTASYTALEKRNIWVAEQASQTQEKRWC